jgi:hypothetical protein
MENQPLNVCPICQKSINSIPVNVLYFELIENKPEFSARFSLSAQQKKELFRYLAPPLIERQPIWQILNPDILFGVIALIVLVTALFLFVDQQESWINSIYFLALLCLIFVLLRKQVMGWFTNKQSQRKKLMSDLSKKADYWSEACYCIQDDIIFHAEDQKTYSPSEFHAINDVGH